MMKRWLRLRQLILSVFGGTLGWREPTSKASNRPRNYISIV
jgi:hypothetical protein